MTIKSLMLATAITASALASVPAAATQEAFASITALNNNRNFRWVKTGSTGGTFYTTTTATDNVAGAVAMRFSPLGPNGFDIDANVLISGTTTADPLGVTTGSFSQVIDSFTFTVTATQGFQLGSQFYNAGTILLQSVGNVTNTRIQGTVGGTTGSFVGSPGAGAAMTFTSPIFTFQPGTTFGFNFGLASLSPAFATTGSNQSLSSFRARLTGDFQSDPLPRLNVPEPGTWAMMIVGMGLVGFARRRRNVAVAA